jgi:hypothetical protein
LIDSKKALSRPLTTITSCFFSWDMAWLTPRAIAAVAASNKSFLIDFLP